jgi:hypothetical protein
MVDKGGSVMAAEVRLARKETSNAKEFSRILLL